MRLWREKTTGMLVIEMDGKSYLAPQPLRIDQRERLEQAARDFANWVGAPLPETWAQPVQSQVQAAPQPLTEQQSSQAQPVQQVTTLREQPPDGQVPPPVRPVSIITGAVPPPGIADTKPKTMVQQIDAVLKELAAGTAMEVHGLSLTEDPRRGVVVWIGATSYEGIDSVPDPEIQKFIRSAVAEWEHRQDAAEKARQKRP